MSFSDSDFREERALTLFFRFHRVALRSGSRSVIAGLAFRLIPLKMLINLRLTYSWCAMVLALLASVHLRCFLPCLDDLHFTVRFFLLSPFQQPKLTLRFPSSETYAPVLLVHKAKRLRKETGQPWFAPRESFDLSVRFFPDASLTSISFDS